MKYCACTTSLERHLLGICTTCSQDSHFRMEEFSGTSGRAAQTRLSTALTLFLKTKRKPKDAWYVSAVSQWTVASSSAPLVLLQRSTRSLRDWMETFNQFLPHVLHHLHLCLVPPFPVQPKCRLFLLLACHFCHFHLHIGVSVVFQEVQRLTSSLT